ncbi:hypothetical protein H4R33_000166 [Dimargaris cristalligena]|nr:hypothetical protein H4R33_000166 [Dimargaris cristalligena]
MRFNVAVATLATVAVLAATLTSAQPETNAESPNHLANIQRRGIFDVFRSDESLLKNAQLELQDLLTKVQETQDKITTYEAKIAAKSGGATA